MESPKSAEEEHTTNNLSKVVENVEKIAKDIGLTRWRVGMIMALQIAGAFLVLAILLLGVMFVVLIAIFGS